jgi:hypothetical protein
MILGTSADTFTQVHVILSLVGIVSGLIVVFGMLGANKLDGLAALFLATTVLTSVTGFFFPVSGFMPSHAIGILSLVFLAAAILAFYAPFLVAQIAVMAIFIVLGILAVRKFHPRVTSAAKSTPY